MINPLTKAKQLSVGVLLICIGLTQALWAQAPGVTSLIINDGSGTTASEAVTLTSICTGTPTEFRASEKVDFNGADWQTYTPTATFSLSAENGEKAVYFKVRNLAGQESGAVCRTVVLAKEATATELSKPGELWRGEITKAGGECWHSFTITAAQSVTVETTLGTLSDNLLALYGSDSKTLLVDKSDDQPGPELAAKLTSSLTTTGVYYVLVTGFGDATGDYGIRLTVRATHL